MDYSIYVKKKNPVQIKHCKIIHYFISDGNLESTKKRIPHYCVDFANSASVFTVFSSFLNALRMQHILSPYVMY